MWYHVLTMEIERCHILFWRYGSLSLESMVPFPFSLHTACAVALLSRPRRGSVSVSFLFGSCAARVCPFDGLFEVAGTRACTFTSACTCVLWFVCVCVVWAPPRPFCNL